MFTNATEETLHTAQAITEKAIELAYPGVDRETALALRTAYAMSQFAKYKASERFGPRHEMTDAYGAAAVGYATDFGSQIDAKVAEVLAAPAG